MCLRTARLLAVALIAAAGSCLAFAGPAAATSRGCGPGGFAYAGLTARAAGAGIAATLSAIAQPVVESGHVAAWVGVGGPNEGPNGEPEWVQVGLSAEPGKPGRLYYEVERGNADPRYFPIASGIPAGAKHRVAVAEVAGRPGTWRVWVDGKPASAPIYLPESHGNLTAMAMSESWDGGQPACNRYAYSFGHVALATRPGGTWRALVDANVLQDRIHRVLDRGAAGFVAMTQRPAIQLYLSHVARAFAALKQEAIARSLARAGRALHAERLAVDLPPQLALRILSL